MGEQSAAFRDIWGTLLAQAALFLTYPASNLSPTFPDSPAVHRVMAISFFLLFIVLTVSPRLHLTLSAWQEDAGRRYV